MKSGLWILGLVIIAGIIFGWYLRGREDRDWQRIEEASDAQQKIEKLESFVARYPGSEHRQQACEMYADLLLNEVGDSARFIGYAEALLASDPDPELEDFALDGLDEARNTRGRLTDIQGIEDPRARIARLEAFLDEFPESRNRDRAYYMMGNAMTEGLKDTTGFILLAERVIAEEPDHYSKAAMFYLLYGDFVDHSPDKALASARRLSESPVKVSWVYEYLASDITQRELDLDIALALSNGALKYAESADDSASSFDSRGWIYYKQGDYDKAMGDLRRAVELTQDPYEPFLRHLGKAALKAGDGDAAFDTFRSILVLGEYDYAQATLDSLMDSRGYSARQRGEFERGIWDSRLAAAEPAQAFSLPDLADVEYSFDPAGKVSLINFMSPT
jgi:tetratricopeptide (TPR) repeat protein